MLIKTKAIVLSKLHYRDHDLIVKCYTSERGLVSYLVRGALKSGRSGSKSAYFQPLSQLQLEENHKPNRSLQYINEVKMETVYQSLHSNLHKSALVLFLSEVLASVLREEEQNHALYEYLTSALNWLDQEGQVANFHIVFLLDLTKHLGFFPNMANLDAPYFNLATGAFETMPDGLYSISGDDLAILKRLLSGDADAGMALRLHAKQRQSFLKVLLLYYELHLGDFKKPQSLEVFNQVFR